MDKRIRVLMAKIGLDCHTRGINVISTVLRDSGMEVIYIGPYKTPEEIVEAAIQEDVDVIGVSSLSAGHMLPFSEICRLIKGEKLDILFIGGGFIPPDEAELLKEKGVAEIFGPGTTTDSVVKYIKDKVSAKAKKRN